ncbi:hypothetical protein GCM10022393_41090 [Aquimarina addita]|uniref:JmjC domain-containing protein n=1 Tax=Aquimarina addita TaxID=870485 RepID=A0ABP6UX69_9FLAO
MDTLLTKKQEIENFADLIYPFEKNVFAKDFWGKQTLHIQRESPEYYNSLLTIENLDEILDHSRPKGWSLRVVKNQVPINPSKYENEDGSLNLNQIYAAYADGHTIVIHEVQRYWKPIQRLCQSLQKEFNFRTLGELFLTPKNQKALSPHYDAHDVFVVQLQGTKHWTLYDEEYQTPLVDSFQPVFDRNQLKNKREIMLKAGDVLFIPRGVPHEAMTMDESSLHLSIGVHPFQWVDLLMISLSQVAQNDVEFRQPLPLGYLNQYKTDDSLKELINTKIERLLQKTSNNLNPSYGIDLLSENFRSNQKSIGDGHFAHLDKIEDINLKTSLAHRDFMTVGVLQIGELSRILFQGNVIKGPEYLGSCFDFIAKATKGFTVSEIPLLDEEGKLKLVKRLVRGGLLKIINI